jgi:DNA-binding MarR family transcriptional regulator
VPGDRAKKNGVSPEVEALTLSCVEVLGRLASVFAERRRQLGESVGLTDQQWQALEEVQTEHFMPSLFAKERSSSAAAVSKILRQLSDKGLITAHVSDVDARQRSYHVTPKGRGILDTLREGRREAIRDVWLELSEDELVSFSGVGGKVADRLEAFAQKKRLPRAPVAPPDDATEFG